MSNNGWCHISRYMNVVIMNAVKTKHPFSYQLADSLIVNREYDVFRGASDVECVDRLVPYVVHSKISEAWHQMFPGKEKLRIRSNMQRSVYTKTYQDRIWRDIEKPAAQRKISNRPLQQLLYCGKLSTSVHKNNI